MYRREKSCPCQDLNSDPLAVQPIACCHPGSLRWLLVSRCLCMWLHQNLSKWCISYQIKFSLSCLWLVVFNLSKTISYQKCSLFVFTTVLQCWRQKERVCAVHTKFHEKWWISIILILHSHLSSVFRLIVCQWNWHRFCFWLLFSPNTVTVWYCELPLSSGISHSLMGIILTY
jgi:hypothetical protein